LNRIKDGSSCQEGSSSGCTAGDFICQQNGFEYAEFVGTKDSYLDFIKENFDAKTFKYFKSIYDLKKSNCLLDFTVAGMKCEKECSKLNDFEILNFKQIGGNCMKSSSSIFVHCKIPQDSRSKTGVWSEWRAESYCATCGVNNLKQQTRQCISKPEKPNDNINLKKSVTCQGDWLKISKCDACEQTDDYEYNAHYYDSSQTYDSSYSDSYDSEDQLYPDYDSAPTWDDNSDPYSNDEPYGNQYVYGSQSSSSNNSKQQRRNRRTALKNRPSKDSRICDLPELKHDLSKYDPFTVKYRGQEQVIPPTYLPTPSTTNSTTEEPTTTKKKTSPIPVIPTSEMPTEQPTINIGPELTTTQHSQSTAEPTVAAIGSTAMIGIIAAIAIAVLGYVSYRFYNKKNSKKETKSKPDLPEETKQLNDSKVDLIVTNVPSYNRQTTQTTHISEGPTTRH